MTTQLSPFFSARVRKPATSEPADGSENSWHQISSPAASFGKWRRLASSLPKAITVGPHMPSPIWNGCVSLP
ncbi:hypothetical protein ACVWZ6_008883 [Bradyrhizobium sp. GM6.1]